MSNFKHKEDQCFVATHTTFMPIVQQCDNTPVTYFEDFTDNHNKTIIRVENLELLGVPLASENAAPPQYPVSALVTVIIDTRDGKTIERAIPINPGFTAERTFQVEDFCRVSVRCECGGVGLTFVEFDLDIDKTFCICCPNEKDDKRHCDRCGGRVDCGCSNKRHKYTGY